MNYVSVEDYLAGQVSQGYRAPEPEPFSSVNTPRARHAPSKRPRPPIYDVNDLMRGTRLQIRHISEGPPPKPTSTPMNPQVRVKKDENASCVFVVRGVNRLGEDCSMLLKNFFSHWGIVASLRFACPARVSHESKDFVPSVAFVVMNSPSEVSAILQQDSFSIAGRRVQVEPYLKTDTTRFDEDLEAAFSILRNLEL